MQKRTIERKAFMRRYFKAWEICAFHLDEIRNTDHPERALWAVLRLYEHQPLKRFKLWLEVVTTARLHHGYEFESIRDHQEKQSCWI